jgi:molybdenum cofactor sulfurtransferase
MKTRLAVDAVRRRIARHFDTNLDDYDVIFCSSTTKALQLLGDSFFPPLNGRSDDSDELSNVSGRSDMDCVDQSSAAKLWIMQESHTSVVGLRSLALQRGYPVTLFNQPSQARNDIKESQHQKHLLVWPLQCNFSGTRYPLQWILDVDQWKDCGWKNSFVCVDAASFLTTSTFSLAKYPADFVVLSFYKMFGFPTGLGRSFDCICGIRNLTRQPILCVFSEY